MYQRMLLCFIVLIAVTVKAQTINVRGTVSTVAGKPVPNAIVSLVRQGLKDTTRTDGKYSISKSTAVKLPYLPPETDQMSLNRGVLMLRVTHPSAVNVEIFNAKGNLLKKEWLPDALAGDYRLDIANNYRATNMLVIHASIGSHAMTFRYLPFNNGAFAVNPSSESSNPIGGNLAKIAAVNDTLKTTATGYMANAAPISAYDTIVNVTLDSGAAGHTLRLRHDA